jgi:hypothetical protein
MIPEGFTVDPLAQPCDRRELAGIIRELVARPSSLNPVTLGEMPLTPYWHFTMASPFAPASPETPGQPDQTGHHAVPEPLSPPAAPRQPQ